MENASAGDGAFARFAAKAVGPGWREALADEFAKPYFAALGRFVEAEYAAGECHPPRDSIFRAFAATPFDEVKVAILGQDPYHERGQATGLAFAVAPGAKTPPSLRNIAKELAADLPDRIWAPDLASWAAQGVLLLNATLTVRDGAAGSHRGKGWETFTAAAVRALAERREGLVFILWGDSARRHSAAIDKTRHLVLESAHPSPLSAHRGFFGSRPFSKANAYLSALSTPPILW